MLNRVGYLSVHRKHTRQLAEEVLHLQVVVEQVAEEFRGYFPQFHVLVLDVLEDLEKVIRRQRVEDFELKILILVKMPWGFSVKN